MDDSDKYPSQLAERFQIRLPDGMRDRLREAAEANNRSMNAEIVARLDHSLARYSNISDDLSADPKRDSLLLRAMSKVEKMYSDLCEKIESGNLILEEQNRKLREEYQRQIESRKELDRQIRDITPKAYEGRSFPSQQRGLPENDYSIIALAETVGQLTELSPDLVSLDAGGWPQRFADLPVFTQVALNGLLHEDAPETYEALMQQPSQASYPSEHLLRPNPKDVVCGERLRALKLMRAVLVRADPKSRSDSQDEGQAKSARG